MKIKKLIEELQKLDKEKTISYYDYEENEEVESFSILKNIYENGKK